MQVIQLNIFTRYCSSIIETWIPKEYHQWASSYQVPTLIEHIKWPSKRMSNITWWKVVICTNVHSIVEYNKPGAIILDFMLLGFPLTPSLRIGVYTSSMNFPTSSNVKSRNSVQKNWTLDPLIPKELVLKNMSCITHKNLPSALSFSLKPSLLTLNHSWRQFPLSLNHIE